MSANQLYPNQNVVKRLFQVVDKDSQDEISFPEFAGFVFLMLDGSKKAKTLFLFRLIAYKDRSVFELEDLVSFFRMSNNLEGDVFTRSYLADEAETVESEMAYVVFDLMNKAYNSKISSEEFSEFLMGNENYVELFNFLNTNRSKKHKNAKIQRNLNILMRNIDRAENEMQALSEALFPNDPYTNNINRLRRISKSFGLVLKDRVVDKASQRFLERFRAISGQTPKWDPAVSALKEPAVPPSSDQTVGPKIQFLNNGAPKLHYRAQNQIRLDDNDFFAEDKGQSETFLNAEELNSMVDSTTDHPPRRTDPAFDRGQVMACLASIREKLNRMREAVEKVANAQMKADIVQQPIKKHIEPITKQIESQAKGQNKKVVFINNKKWNLATSLINGIQKSLSIVSTDGYHPLSPFDFKLHNKIELEALTPSAFSSCKFKDFAPYVFQSIRRHFGITNEAYIRSIGVNTFQSAFFHQLSLMLSENSSGKSGSFFFHTQDGKYMIKTIHRSEFDVLLETLPHYHAHLMKNPNTLLNRFYGLHQLKCYDASRNLTSDLCVVVMNNVFDMATPELIRTKFDLKGSTYGRVTKERDVARGAAKKDLNFLAENVQLRLSPRNRTLLLAQTESDTAFLAKHNIIDYSMLIGVIDSRDDPQASGKRASSDQDLQTDPKAGTFIASVDEELHYYIGIIDTLTLFNTRKKGEFVVKRIFEGKGVSCVPPDEYRDRFNNFIAAGIPPEPEGKRVRFLSSDTLSYVV